MSLRRRTVQLLLTAALSGSLLASTAVATARAANPVARSLSFPAALPASSPASLPAATARNEEGVPLRVATWNIHAGTGTDHAFDPERQAAHLRSLNADVIGLQEVDRHWSDRSAWRDLAGELAQRLGMHLFFAPVYSLDPPRPGAPRAEFGVAVLSRYRITSVVNHEITRLSTQVPNPVPAPAPGFGEAVVRVRGLPVHIYVTHLDYRPDPAVRVAQVSDTRRIMARDRGPKILLGDFNAEPGAPELAPLWRELTDAAPGAPTFPAEAPVKRIDFVAVSKGGPRGAVAVRRAWVPASTASDHRPVVADLLLRVRGRADHR
ncbi:Endonuclease/Exonuclease/phosphatase family protein [Streptomyces sp. ADI96-02]|uniref:endonuclease/exonuclease/phosphatase family protein n=1 Tax=Streptomyces sp. ADI96-02 TaxID=1522760 RepID=UPI000F54F20F|nr:endonuclease/exonuclease/phosphatase family protein [Streptomyces sp. ADI96-02]RPK61863.1 Endonuclease/Exonuclease/phosphatase family protein [Streptomyces sp. ADI96-02]